MKRSDTMLKKIFLRKCAQHYVAEAPPLPKRMQNKRPPAIYHKAVRVNLTMRQHELLTGKAKEAGVTVSDFVRRFVAGLERANAG